MLFQMLLLIFVLPCLVSSHPRPDSGEDLSAEFRSGDSSFFDLYDWGYVVSPTNRHVQRKGPDGVVTGNVAFVNANGNNVQWSYVANPNEGIKVTEYKEPAPEIQDVSNRHTNAVRQRPLLKSAEGLGYLRAAGFDGDQAQFKVDDELIRSAGGESQLAHNLGAIPVAAVHDVRGPPRKVAVEQTAPLLVAKQSGTGLKDFFLLVPSRK